MNLVFDLIDVYVEQRDIATANIEPEFRVTRGRKG